jgi:hypothetical protein
MVSKNIGGSFAVKYPRGKTSDYRGLMPFSGPFIINYGYRRSFAKKFTIATG